jgi:hypothetical protein
LFDILKGIRSQSLKFEYFPDKKAVDKAIGSDDPLLLLVSFDESKAIVSNIDDSFEHSILLKKSGYKETDIDVFFRIVLNRQGADWTFVCPTGYKGLTDRDRRIESFYNDGILAISKAVKQLGYDVQVEIPDRYRRHFNTLSNDEK